jgi:hypothetical protein
MPSVDRRLQEADGERVAVSAGKICLIGSVTFGQSCKKNKCEGRIRSEKFVIYTVTVRQKSFNILSHF